MGLSFPPWTRHDTIFVLLWCIVGLLSLFFLVLQAQFPHFRAWWVQRKNSFRVFHCAWHGKGRRICRRCTPKVLAALQQADKQRDAYSSSLSGAVEQVDRLDRELTTARSLLGEAAAIFKRGRYPRPLSNRIVAFLEGS